MGSRQHDSTKKKHWKKFTYAEIQEKVSQRWNYPEYYDVLMKSAVSEDADGVYFDVKNPAWKELVTLVRRGPSITALPHPLPSKSSDDAAAAASATSSSASHSNVSSRSPLSRSATTTASIASPHSVQVLPPTRAASATSGITGGRGGRPASAPTPPRNKHSHPHHHHHNHHDADADAYSNGTTSASASTRDSSTSSASASAAATNGADGDGADGGGSLSSEESRAKFIKKAQLKRSRLSRSKQELLEALSHALQAASPDPETVRTSCSIVGVPSAYRGLIWKILLGLPRHRGDDGAPELLHIVSNRPLFNQRVIRVDIERTRANDPKFQEPDTRNELEVILTEYCRNEGISYKQGMNYILAPFFMVGLDGRDEIYAAFAAFIARIMPNTFTDDEFGGLQSSFRFFRILLLYHCPQLCNFLDQYDISPELFCAPWFVTLHGSRLEKNTLLFLWDQLLLADDPRLHFFMSLALLISHTTEIMKQDFVELPEFISKIAIESKDHVKRLVRQAKEFIDQTPASFHSKLLELSSDHIMLDSDEYKKLEHMVCMHVTSEEVVLQLYAEMSEAEPSTSSSATPTFSTDANGAAVDQRESSDSIGKDKSRNNSASSSPRNTNPKPKRKGGGGSGKGGGNLSKSGSNVNLKSMSPHFHTKHNANLKFFILDCRPRQQYDAGHLPCAFHFDPRLYLQLEQLAKRVENLMAMAAEGCHFCFFGDGRSTDNVLLSLKLYFLQKGFKYVSFCEGGYRECHKIVTNGHELVDHHPAKCIECIHNANTDKGGLGWVSRAQGKLANFMSDAAVKRKTKVIAKKYSQIPNSVLLLPSSYETLLLHTVLRDKATSPQKFRSCVHRLIAMLVGNCLDFIQLREVSVKTVGNTVQKGFNTRKNLHGVALSDAAESALRLALEPFTPVSKASVGQLKFEEKFVQDADGVLRSSKAPLVGHVPQNIADRLIIIFEPTLTEVSSVKDAIEELIRRGVSEDDIIFLSLIACRPTLWAIAEAFPRVRMVTTVIDALQNGQAVPGLGNFESRYTIQ